MRVKTRLVDSKLGQLSEPTGCFKDLCLSQSVTIASVSGPVLRWESECNDVN